ncbi:MAG: gamma-glutamylcyclotransferase [Alphaproteobacteria bacterium]|nr:gamma-glutamylcyclotransferase [Alphaproteobacteria bacterium]
MTEYPFNPPPTSFTQWSDEQRGNNLQQTLAASPDPSDLWVFGAGSLIWDPRFEPLETRTAFLPTYRRAFCFWTVRARGSFERPGLGLALEAGGTCAGVAFRLPKEGRDEILDALWRREMSGGVYVPTWISAETDQGPIWTLGFVGNRSHRNYAGILPLDQSARIIASALGTSGTCHEYVALLAEALDHYGLEDPETRDLHVLVQQYLTELS